MTYLANARPVRIDYVSCGTPCCCGGGLVRVSDHCCGGGWGLGFAAGFLGTLFGCIANLAWGSSGGGYSCYASPDYIPYPSCTSYPPPPSMFMPMMNYSAYGGGYSNMDTFQPSYRRESASTSTSTSSTNNTTIVINKNNADGTVETTEVKVKTEADIKNLSEEDFEAIRDNKQAAISTLKSLGYIDGNIVKKLPAPKGEQAFRIMQLIAVSELNVNVAKNPQAAANDHMLRGKIINVQLNDGKLEYFIDNSSVASDYGLLYHFVQKEKDGNEFFITKIGNLTGKDYYVNDAWITPPSAQGEEKKPVENEAAAGARTITISSGTERIYTYQANDGLLHIDAAPLIRKDSTEGYSKIEKNKGYEKSGEGQVALGRKVTKTSNGEIKIEEE